MLCHKIEKAELNLLWGISKNRTINQKVEITEAVIFMELSNNEMPCCVKLLVIVQTCPKETGYIN